MVMAKQRSKKKILAQRSKKKQKSLIFVIFKWLFILFLFVGFLSCAGVAGLYYSLSQDLPKLIHCTIIALPQ